MACWCLMHRCHIHLPSRWMLLPRKLLARELERAEPWALMALMMMVWLTTISFGMMMGQLRISRYLYVLVWLFILFLPGIQFMLCAFLLFIISFSSLNLFFISSSLLMFHKKKFIHWIDKFTFKVTFRSSWLQCLWGDYKFPNVCLIFDIFQRSKFFLRNLICYSHYVSQAAINNSFW